MDSDKLESTNQLLHDLERKLSLVLLTSLTYTAHSHGSVVQDPTHSGLARKNIQLSVLQYIKGNTSEFDADRVFSDRQEKFATSFAKEYSPSQPSRADSRAMNTHGPITRLILKHSEPECHPRPVEADKESIEPHEVSEETSDYALDEYPDYFDEEFDSEDDFESQDHMYEDDHGDSDDDDMLLPPLPPRLPPREMDPTKLYGLFDFLGPDPLHCTLYRDEPVYLLNDLDNYWWLIRKLNKLERKVLWHDRGSQEEIISEDEDGKIGFVPAECLETYGERLARLNCFKNEEIERFSRETLILLHTVSNNSLHEDLGPHGPGVDLINQNNASASASASAPAPTQQPSLSTLSLRRLNSILKRAGENALGSKLVTFENLGDIHLDDDDLDSDDVIDFSDHYYSVSHEDVAIKSETDTEKHSEVLSDIYPADAPLEFRKSRTSNNLGNILQTAELRDFAQPKLVFTGDNASIGSFSPDTPPTRLFTKTLHDESTDDETNLRRSVILDRLNIVTLDIQGETSSGNSAREPTFGGSLNQRTRSDEDTDGSDYERYFSDDHGKVATQNNAAKSRTCEENENLDDQYSRKSVLAEEINTPLTSLNSLNCVSTSPKAPPPVREKRKKRPVHDMFMPILGQLDELTEKLAELEHIL